MLCLEINKVWQSVRQRLSWHSVWCSPPQRRAWAPSHTRTARVRPSAAPCLLTRAHRNPRQNPNLRLWIRKQMIRQAYRLLNPMRTAPVKRTQVLCRLNRKATRILTAVRPLRMLILRQVRLSRSIPAVSLKTAMSLLQIVSRSLAAVLPVM